MCFGGEERSRSGASTCWLHRRPSILELELCSRVIPGKLEIEFPVPGSSRGPGLEGSKDGQRRHGYRENEAVTAVRYIRSLRGVSRGPWRGKAHSKQGKGGKYQSFCLGIPLWLCSTSIRSRQSPNGGY